MFMGARLLVLADEFGNRGRPVSQTTEMLLNGSIVVPGSTVRFTSGVISPGKGN